MINNVNSLNHSPFNWRNINTTTPQNKDIVAFCGLKSQYEKAVYVSSDYLQTLTGVYPKAQGRVGELPIEMIRALKANNPDNLSEKIKETYEAFALCANILKNADDRKAKINPEKLMRHYLDLKFESKDEEAKKLLVSVTTNEIVQSEYMDSLQKEAANVLTNRLQALGILPEDATTELKYAGYGRFKEAYSLDFIDKDGNSLYGKFALKMYKNPERTQIAHNRFLENLSMFLSSKEFEDMSIEYFRKHPNFNLYNEITTAQLYLKHDLSVPTEHREILRNRDGIHPDANAAMFIKGAIGGDIDKTDKIRMFFFDFNNKFSLARLSDETLPKPTIYVDLEKFGLLDDDPAEHNFLHGRLIDYGSIIPITPKGPINVKTDKDLSPLARNKVARQTYGKIRRIAKEYSIQEARQAYEALHKKARENAVPQSKSVLKGLELARQYILNVEET